MPVTGTTTETLHVAETPFFALAVIVVLPLATAVTRPSLTVATDGELLLQVISRSVASDGEIVRVRDLDSLAFKLRVGGSNLRLLTETITVT